MVSGLKGELLRSKVDPCAKSNKRVMVNSVMCTKCCKWVHARCAKTKRVTNTLAKGFVCEQCVETKKEPNKKTPFFDHVKCVKSCCYLGTG